MRKATSLKLAAHPKYELLAKALQAAGHDIDVTEYATLDAVLIAADLVLELRSLASDRS